MNWSEKLEIFISDFEHMGDAIGILVCGSYVTGSPSKHSDLDVHIVLDNRAEYRERGNKIIDGFLIEYFANPPRQILKYFEEDIREKSLMCQTQFATGKIMLDKTGDVAALKEKALTMIEDFYKGADDNPTMTGISKYFLWDMLDDLQDAYETQRPDFDLLYFNSLNRIVGEYMRCIGRTYHYKTIFGNITDDTVRRKYLLRELPDAKISSLIAAAITAVGRKEKLDNYQMLTETIIDRFGGFDIDGFKLKSALDLG